MMESVTDAANKPLVSFVLFAYNQERFIREAVAGALAQTYEPLEIVLSDDGSSDRTFEIMQELVAEYTGPHQVRVIRNDPNLGLIQHVMKRCREAQGEIVVVAAGDDISRPERTSLAVAPMLANRDVFATVSRVDIIDENGKKIADGALRPLHFSEPEIFVNNCASKRLVIQGCSAVYRKEVFALELGNSRMQFPEDMLFSFYIHSLGKLIEDVEHSLVDYRLHDQAQSNNRGFKGTQIESETFSRRNAMNNVQMYGLFFEIMENSKFRHIFDADRLRRALDFELLMSNWGEIGFFSRVLLILRRIADNGKLPWKWMAMRMFGTFPRYQPRMFVASIQAVLQKRR